VFNAFHRAHRSSVWSSHSWERVNKEIKRRARAIGIFPNDAGVIRLLGARGLRGPAQRIANRRPPLPLRMIHGAPATQQR
jgi:transposase-like protein